MEGEGSLNSRWTWHISVCNIRLTGQHTLDEKQEAIGMVLVTWGSPSMEKRPT